MEVELPEHDDELDTRIRGLLRAAQPPVPPPDFVFQTMKAVRAAPLPAGRVALRHPWSVLIGWLMLVAATAIVYAAFVVEPLGARMFASFISLTLRGCAHFVRYAAAGLAVSEMFVTLGDAVARAAATREGTTTLLLTATVAATSLLALQRLLFSKGEESKWQELS